MNELEILTRSHDDVPEPSSDAWMKARAAIAAARSDFDAAVPRLGRLPGAWRRRRPLAALLGARASLTAAALGGTALVIAVVVLASAGTSGDPAYALTKSADGSVTLTVSELVGVSGANQRLASLGLPVVVARMEPGCTATGQVVEIGPAEHDIVEPQRPRPAGQTWVIHPAAIPRGDTLQIALRYGRPITFGGRPVPALIGSSAVFRGTAPSCVSTETPGP